LIAAPCFPSYPSGHATTSYAAREVLERTFGRQAEHTIVVATPAVPGVVLRYRKRAQTVPFRRLDGDAKFGCLAQLRRHLANDD
jgi:hypothetical protein